MTSSLLAQNHGFPPEGEVFSVRSLDLRVREEPHPWYEENRAAIAANWEHEVAANPKLFDGRMVFQHRVAFRDGHIAGHAHLVPFSAFLYWRKTRPAGGTHLFSMPFVISADDALVAIRMAETTANPGRVYCPAGSIEPQDVIDGRCDVDFNMRREVLEETGLDLGEAEADPGYFGTQAINTVMIFRLFRFPLPADEIIARIARHIADDPEPEISEALAIRDADPDAHDYTYHMRPALKWLFEKRDQ
jgi:8-oxo-dGTP pyrophosphatase MutT (NUDIX family)